MKPPLAPTADIAVAPQSIRPQATMARAQRRFDLAVQQWSRAVVRGDLLGQFTAAVDAALFAPDPDQAERFDHAALTVAARLSAAKTCDSTLIAARAAAVAAHAAQQQHRLGQPELQTQYEELADDLRRRGLTSRTVAAIAAIE